MIVMTPQASKADIDAVTKRLETTGVHVVVMPGELTTAIGAIGDPEGVAELGLEGMRGVDRVVPISRPYKLASKELSHFEPTIVEVDGHRIGAPDRFCLIAGPCTVESRDQTLVVARAVAASGAAILRGGAFKPRTSPFAFKGLGVQALEILAEARAETGLPVVTEFLDTQHAEAIAAHADVVQIGARNMQNYALLEVAGKLGSRCCSSAGCRRRWTSCCRRPTTSSRRATRTSSCASAGSGRSRPRLASRSTSAPCPG